MLPRLTTLVAVMAALMLVCTGCSTTGDTSGGWVIIDPHETPPPPPPSRSKPPETAKKNRGQVQAGVNHLRSAYRFLQKNKADHALKELEKARYKLGADFRVYYYKGGAYYFKGMYSEAFDSWQTARRYTRDPRLRSRLRTCQAYALNHLEGDRGSMPFFKEAIDLDNGNRHAWDLMESLENSGERERGVESGGERNTRFSSGSETDEHSRFAKEMIRGRDDTDKDAGKKYDNGNDYDHREWEEGKPGRKGQKKDRHNKKPHADIRDLDQFKSYFLVELF